jgi:septum site-determining protein MinC
MAVASKAPAAPVIFDLKSATLTLVALVLKTTDWAELERELDERFGNVPDFFDHDPVAIDLAQVRDAAADIDFDALLALLRRHKMVPIAAKGGSAPQMEAARAAGLVEAPDGVGAASARPAPDVMPEVVLTEVIREVPVAPAALVVDKPLRSGQQVYARGGDLIVLAVVSYGAEVIADGSIHVYAPLRGRAIAGAKGDANARIYTTCMEPQLLSIAGFYRTTEIELPADVLGKPAQVRLDGERLVVEALKS